MATPRSTFGDLRACMICDVAFRTSPHIGPAPTVCSPACDRVRATQRTRDWRFRDRARRHALKREADAGRELAQRLSRVLADASSAA